MIRHRRGEKVARRRDPSETEKRHADAPAPGPFARPVETARLDARRGAVAISEAASVEERAAIVAAYGLLSLDAFLLEGAFEPMNAGAWRLTARLRATAAQPCVVTLDPVPQEIDLEIERRYAPEKSLVGGKEVEIDPEAADADEIEPLPEILDLGEVALEEFALALNPYPRAAQAELSEAAAAPPGAEPFDAAREHPFAGLAGLRDELAKKTQADDE